MTTAQGLIIWFLVNAIAVTLLHNASRSRGPADCGQLSTCQRPEGER